MYLFSISGQGPPCIIAQWHAPTPPVCVGTEGGLDLVFEKILCVVMRYAHHPPRGGHQERKYRSRRTAASAGKGHASIRYSCASVWNGYASDGNGCASVWNGYVSDGNGCASVGNGRASDRNGCASVGNGRASARKGRASTGKVCVSAGKEGRYLDLRGKLNSCPNLRNQMSVGVFLW